MVLQWAMFHFYDCFSGCKPYRTRYIGASLQHDRSAYFKRAEADIMATCSLLAWWSAILRDRVSVPGAIKQVSHCEPLAKDEAQA